MLYAYMYLCDFVIPGFCVKKNSQRCKIILKWYTSCRTQTSTDRPECLILKNIQFLTKKILNKIHNNNNNNNDNNNTNNNNDFILVSMYLALQLGNWGHFPMYWQTNLLHDF